MSELNEHALQLIRERERAKAMEAEARRLKKLEEDRQRERARQLEAEARRVKKEAELAHKRAMEDQTRQRQREQALSTWAKRRQQ